MKIVAIVGGCAVIALNAYTLVKSGLDYFIWGSKEDYDELCNELETQIARDREALKKPEFIWDFEPGKLIEAVDKENFITCEEVESHKYGWPDQETMLKVKVHNIRVITDDQVDIACRIMNKKNIQLHDKLIDVWPDKVITGIQQSLDDEIVIYNDIIAEQVHHIYEGPIPDTYSELLEEQYKTKIDSYNLIKEKLLEHVKSEEKLKEYLELIFDNKLEASDIVLHNKYWIYNEKEFVKVIRFMIADDCSWRDIVYELGTRMLKYGYSTTFVEHSIETLGERFYNGFSDWQINRSKFTPSDILLKKTKILRPRLFSFMNEINFKMQNKEISARKGIRLLEFHLKKLKASKNYINYELLPIKIKYEIPVKKHKS